MSKINHTDVLLTALCNGYIGHNRWNYGRRHAALLHPLYMRRHQLQDLYCLHTLLKAVIESAFRLCGLWKRFEAN